MVVGKDPYAYKGLADLAEVHVRADKMGGFYPLQLTRHRLSGDFVARRYCSISIVCVYTLV
jgi:hypothetical protein